MPRLEGAHISGNVIVQPSVSVEILPETGVDFESRIATPATGWALTSAVYDSVFLNIVGQDTAINGLFFAPDVIKKAYFVGSQNNRVYEVDLATAGTLVGAAYNGVSFLLTSNSSPTGMFFKPDGLQLYVVNFSLKRVERYTLTIAWDLSTAGAAVVDSVSTNGVANGPIGVTFNPTGTKMFVADQTSNVVYQYGVLTPWVLAASAVYDTISLSVAAQTSLLTDLFLRPDGKKLFISEQTNNSVYQYDLPTPNILTGGSFDTGEVFDLTPQGSGPNGVFFDPLGFKMWTADNTNDKLQQYTLTA